MPLFVPYPAFNLDSTNAMVDSPHDEPHLLPFVAVFPGAFRPCFGPASGTKYRVVFIMFDRTSFDIADNIFNAEALVSWD